MDSMKEADQSAQGAHERDADLCDPSGQFGAGHDELPSGGDPPKAETRNGQVKQGHCSMMQQRHSALVLSRQSIDQDAHRKMFPWPRPTVAPKALV